MNRIFFIGLLFTIFIVGYQLMINEVRGYAFFILLMASVLTFLRRYHLKMKPWWGGRLRDIPNYFKEP